MILLIDNYDSFSYNLVQLAGSIRADIKVIRNDEYNCEEIANMNPERIILSPGPGRPAYAGVCEQAVQYFKGSVPILGVCLGHQAICESFGGTIAHAKQLMHGKQSLVTLDSNDKLFQGLPKQIKVARYHSLAADPANIPNCLSVTAQTSDGEIMAVKHKEYEIYGLQFHPESILTEYGMEIVRNFIEFGS